jgi:hypothetical protein
MNSRRRIMISKLFGQAYREPARNETDAIEGHADISTAPSIRRS